MVQLKERCKAQLSYRLCYFNSFMVQLKAGAASQSAAGSGFQFLHGTIKRRATLSEALLPQLFQFLHGTIKRKAE